jgi:hypothetical protein
MDDAECDKLKGERLDESHYDILIEDPVKVLKPDGSLLCQIVRGGGNNVLPQQILSDKIKGLPDNRGTSSGKDVLTGQGSNRRHPVKSGYNSRTNRVDKNVFRSGELQSNSGIVGYFDRYARFPYARETSFIVNYPKEWQTLQPFISSVDAVFKENAPDRYAIQKELAERCSSDWIIGDTAFSTITVNKSYRTACHKDAGDLAEGFGVMAYFQSGKISGGYLVLPAYRVALKLQHGDIVLFDVHEWHGNTPIKPLSANAERITCVFYLREKLLRCGDAKYEIQRAKKVRQIGKLYDDDEIKKAEHHKTEVLAKHGISYPYPKQKKTRKQTIPTAKK